MIEDKEVQRIAENKAKRHELIDLPLGLPPRCVRRAMGLVFAPWITLDGAESGVFCQDCLYVTGKDRNHVWEAHFSKNGCRKCRHLRLRDKFDRNPVRYSVMLPAHSDVHLSRTDQKIYNPQSLVKVDV